MGMRIKQEPGFAGGVRLDGAFPEAAANEGVEGAEDGESFESASSQLAHALQRLEQQNKLIAFFEEKWLAAQHDVEILMDSQSRTRERLARLTEHSRHLYRMAINDEVTGLANRRLAMDRLALAIAQAERSHKMIGVVFLELTDLDQLRQQHGREVADQVLKQLAGRLRACVRRSDTVGRYGNHAFIMILPEIQGPENVDTVLQKLRARMVVPFLLENLIIRLGGDFGVALHPVDARRPRELVQRAEADLHDTKQLSGNGAGLEALLPHG